MSGTHCWCCECNDCVPWVEDTPQHVIDAHAKTPEGQPVLATKMLRTVNSEGKEPTDWEPACDECVKVMRQDTDDLYSVQVKEL